MDTMVKAKLLTGIDDGGFMYKKINLEYICPQCFSVLKRVVNPEFKVSQKKAVFVTRMMDIVLYLKNLKCFVKKINIQKCYLKINYLSVAFSTIIFISSCVKLVSDEIVSKEEPD